MIGEPFMTVVQIPGLVFESQRSMHTYTHTTKTTHTFQEWATFLQLLIALHEDPLRAASTIRVCYLTFQLLSDCSSFFPLPLFIKGREVLFQPPAK